MKNGSTQLRYRGKKQLLLREPLPAVVSWVTTEVNRLMTMGIDDMYVMIYYGYKIMSTRKRGLAIYIHFVIKPKKKRGENFPTPQRYQGMTEVHF